MNDLNTNNDQYDNLLWPLLNWLQAGKKVAIATLISISGGSPRPVGAQLLVTENDCIGAISSGCVEADIILAAREVIASEQVRQQQYGAGSPYIDLTLPCGSSISVVLSLAPSLEQVAMLCDHHTMRREARLTLDITSGQWLEYNDQHAADEKYFICRYQVAKRLVVIGKGAILAHVEQIAASSGLEVICYSPDYTVDSANKVAMANTQDFNPVALDSATAVLLLFHDHDWEAPVLKQILVTDVCYIGAIGSLNSHYHRVNELRASGFTDTQCAKITSPAGLIKGTRHPQHIALSMVAEALQKLCSV